MKNKKIISFILSAVFCGSLFAGNFVLAVAPQQGTTAPSVASAINSQLNAAGKTSGLGARDPRETATLLIAYLLRFVGIIFLVYVLYAGFTWMTAGGEEEKIKTAKKHLTNGIIGLIIILAAYSITIIVDVYLIRATTGDRYYQIPGGASAPWFAY